MNTTSDHTTSTSFFHEIFHELKHQVWNSKFADSLT